MSVSVVPRLSRRWRHPLRSHGFRSRVTTNKRAREVAQGQRPVRATVFVPSSPSQNKELNIAKSVKLVDEIEMEVMDSPLNRKSWQLSLLQAHHYGRKADQLVAKEKYEEAIVCHIEAAELLKEAVSATHSEQVRLSLELQRDRHLQQQRLITMSCKQAKLKGKPPASPSKHSSPPITPCQTVLQSPPLGWKAAKDDKTRLEEQSTAIADLWKLMAVLLTENKRLLEEQEKLKAENASLKRDPYEDIARPAQPSPLGVRLLHVPSDLQHEIQLLLEMANDS